MQPIIILSAYDAITPVLFERHRTPSAYGQPIISACLSDRWLARLDQPAAFPEDERAELAGALVGVQRVHLVNSAADLDALQQRYATRDMAVIDVPALASLTPPRRRPECESVPSHRPGYYPPAPA